MAMNAILGGKQTSRHNGHGSSPLSGLASQFLGGGHGGGHGGSHGGGGGGSGGHDGKQSTAGKLVGQLASNLLSPSDKPEQPQNYHGGQSSGGSQHHQGGLAGAVFGGVAQVFGGKHGHESVS